MSYLDGKGSDPLKMKDSVKRNKALTGKKNGPGSYFTPNAKTFTQDSGARANQKFVIRRGKSGEAIRVYETGDTASTGRKAKSSQYPVNPTPDPKPPTRPKLPAPKPPKPRKPGNKVY